MPSANFTPRRWLDRPRRSLHPPPPFSISNYAWDIIEIFASARTKSAPKNRFFYGKLGSFFVEKRKKQENFKKVH